MRKIPYPTLRKLSLLLSFWIHTFLALWVVHVREFWLIFWKWLSSLGGQFYYMLMSYRFLGYVSYPIFLDLRMTTSPLWTSISRDLFKYVGFHCPSTRFQYFLNAFLIIFSLFERHTTFNNFSFNLVIEFWGYDFRYCGFESIYMRSGMRFPLLLLL